jgi:putative Mg2+ transporter-C (MgtC) family protein
MSVTDIFTRLALAAAIGLLIGYERERHGRSAGLRTQIIVSVSSCLLMILSLELKDVLSNLTASSVVRLDPGRIASYAVAGIGFLGAGTIIRGKGSIQGLTTAACLWFANAAGLTVGAGFLLPAVICTLLVMFVLVVMQKLISRIPRDTYWRVYMDFDTCGDKIPDIVTLINDVNVHLIHSGFECRFDSSTSSYELALRVKSTQDLTRIQQSLRRLEGLKRLRWTEGYVP